MKWVSCYDAQIRQGHTVDMVGTQILHIKSKCQIRYDTIRSHFEVPVHHRSHEINNLCQRRFYL